MSAARTIPRAPSKRAAAGFAIVLLTLIAMLAVTWRSWPEPVTDFGRELYVPWQLSQGKVLYRDVAYFNGPLSPYFNALIFKLLGPGLMKLAGVNIAILVAIEFMLYRLAVKMSDNFAATVSCCAFTMLLAVGQPGPVGNYNFITPYSHEMTHGMALSLAAIACLVRYAETRKRGWICASGAIVGSVFLTKPEIFAAVSVATSVGLFLSLRQKKTGWSDLVFFATCGFAIVLVAMGLLMLAIPIREAASGVFGAWGSVFDSRITHLPFYQRVRGTFDPGETFRALTLMSLGYATVFGVPLLVARFIPHDPARSAWRFTSSLGVFAAILLFFREQIQWEEAGRPILLIAIACAGVFVVRAIRAPESVAILRGVFALFSLLLLAKIVLHVQFYHYGFALSAPGLVVCAMLVCGWLPKWIESRGKSGWILRGGSVAVIAVTCAMYVYFGHRQVKLKTTLVGSGSDAFWSRRQGVTVNEAAANLSALPPNATVAVMPEGAMINYLSRRPNPTPFIVLMPPEVIMFGDETIVQQFQSHPPDYIVLMKPDVSEYGSAGFDVDYGRRIYEWVSGNYRTMNATFSDPSVRLMKRITSDPPG